MRVALVHDFLIKQGGAERVLYEFAAMFPDAPIYCLLYDEERMGKVFPKERIRVSGLQWWYQTLKHIPFLRALPTKLLLPLIIRAVESFNMAEYDLVLSSHTAWAHGMVTTMHTTHVCYCHSPMRFAWDYTNEYQSQIVGKSRIGRLILGWLLKPVRHWDVIASARPTLYLANSHNVRRRIEKYYDRTAEVLYPPVLVEGRRLATVREDFFLIVSTLTAYKRIDIAIQTFNKIDRPLVIIGEGSHRKTLERMAGDNITFTGFLSDEEIKDYMAKARAFIFPGEEDFGMTPVEAMAHGTPVIAYGKGGILEIVEHGKTGVLFSQPTPESLETAIAGFFTTEHRFDPREISSSVQHFGKRRFTQQLHKILKPYLGDTLVKGWQIKEGQ